MGEDRARSVRRAAGVIDRTGGTGHGCGLDEVMREFGEVVIAILDVCSLERLARRLMKRHPVRYGDAGVEDLTHKGVSEAPRPSRKGLDEDPRTHRRIEPTDQGTGSFPFKAGEDLERELLAEHGRVR